MPPSTVTSDKAAGKLSRPQNGSVAVAGRVPYECPKCGRLTTGKRCRAKPASEKTHNNPERRFDAAYAIDKQGCWIWTGSRNSNGYGKLKVDSGSVYAHRYSYERFIGAIPAGHTIDHLCRVRACCNPAHLEPVTQGENNRRGVYARKVNAALGWIPEPQFIRKPTQSASPARLSPNQPGAAA